MGLSMSTIGLGTQLSNLNLFKDESKAPEDPLGALILLRLGQFWRGEEIVLVCPSDAGSH